MFPDQCGKSLRHHYLRRTEPPQSIAQCLRRKELARKKFTSGQVERGHAEAIRHRRHGDEKIVLLRLKLSRVKDAARRQDLRDLPPHDLPRATGASIWSQMATRRPALSSCAM